MTEIETVTVTFEELRADIDRYLEMAESIRVLVMRDGEQVAVMGPWLRSEIVMTEVHRGLHRTAATDRSFDLSTSLRRAAFFLEQTRLHPIRRATLRHAANFFEPKLHTLDAIHVVSALEVRPIDFFVTHDKRQAKAARRAGLPTISPSA